MAVSRTLPSLGLGAVDTQAWVGGELLLTRACALQTDLGAILEGGDFLGVAGTPGAAGEQATLGKSGQRSAAMLWTSVGLLGL